MPISPYRFLNGAGGSVNDPVLEGLGIKLVLASGAMDIAGISGVWIDQNETIPGTTDVVDDLTPNKTLLLSGLMGVYNDTTKIYNLGTTAGLTLGDPINITHPNATGIFFIRTIPAAGDVTLIDNPMDGLGNKTNIQYQVGWRYNAITGTAPVVSSAQGTENFFKVRVTDAQGAIAQDFKNFFIRNTPNGADFIEVAGGNYTGRVVGNREVSLNILRNWLNNGGVTHVQLASHSVQEVNNFSWIDAGGTGEVLLSVAENGLTTTIGDGLKYGRLLLKSYPSAVVSMGVDISVRVDTSGPALTLSIYGT